MVRKTIGSDQPGKGDVLMAFPVLALTGPTAVGKTALSIRLAREIHGEIISVDSVQVYRGLNIGTAKPGPAEMHRVPHHLIDILEPDEPFDAAYFARKAGRIIKSMTARGKIPVLVGGTGLYLKALLNGIAPCPEACPSLRRVLRDLAQDYGKMYLYDLLADIDPESGRRIHPMDLFRVIRALEVYFLTGESISTWHRKDGSVLKRAFPCIKIGLVRSREELYRRIDRRVDVMMREGLVEEVRDLLARGYSPGLKPLQSIGYRHIISFLRGEMSFREAVRQMKRDTRRYCRRQLTWLRKDPEIRWFNPDLLMQSSYVWRKIMGADRTTK